MNVSNVNPLNYYMLQVLRYADRWHYSIASLGQITLHGGIYIWTCVLKKVRLG